MLEKKWSLLLSQAGNMPAQSYHSDRMKWLDSQPVWLPTDTHSARALILGEGFGGRPAGGVGMFSIGYFLNLAYSGWFLQIAYPSFNRDPLLFQSCVGHTKEWFIYFLVDNTQHKELNKL